MVSWYNNIRQLIGRTLYLVYVLRETRVAQMDWEDVRYYAEEYGWHEVQCNPRSAVLGFKRGNQRVNVYYSTGTIGTCVDHPRSGKTQLFRRNQTLEDLIEIFEDPRVHTGKGYYQKQFDPARRGERRKGFLVNMEDDDNARHLFRELDSDSTKDVAVGYGTYFGWTHAGDTWWGAGLPTGLHNKLKGRQSWLPPVEYVALDPSNPNRYYVRFTDGKAQWQGPESLSEAIQNADSEPDVLCFAPEDGWYIKWKDGCTSWLGIPHSLHNQLNGRQKSLPGVEAISIGGNYEWWVRFKDGSWRSRGLSDSLSNDLDELKSDGKDVLDIKLGDNYDYMVMYM